MNYCEFFLVKNKLQYIHFVYLLCTSHGNAAIYLQIICKIIKKIKYSLCVGWNELKWYRMVWGTLERTSDVPFRCVPAFRGGVPLRTHSPSLLHPRHSTITVRGSKAAANEKRDLAHSPLFLSRSPCPPFSS